MSMISRLGTIAMIATIAFLVFVIFFGLITGLEKQKEISLAIASERDACEQYHKQAINSALASVQIGNEPLGAHIDTHVWIQARAMQSVAFSTLYRDCKANAEKAKQQ